MSRIAAPLLLLVALAFPAWAADYLRPIAQVPLLPLADGPHEDIDALVQDLWKPYYNTADEHAFGRDNLRVGRVDLDGDGKDELVLMIDAPGWNDVNGNTLVVAQWRNKHWFAIGLGWGDEDTVFTTNDIRQGWRTIETGTQLMRWVGREYKVEEKAASAE
ncbi:MAG TPA: hypothetical protein VL974_10975 [Magnetospirillum sp.]|jgi:hypothetical protein|nr:hypothetical protein [Magnetospirillum sp.]